MPGRREQVLNVADVTAQRHNNHAIVRRAPDGPLYGAELHLDTGPQPPRRLRQRLPPFPVDPPDEQQLDDPTRRRLRTFESGRSHPRLIDDQEIAGC